VSDFTDLEIFVIVSNLSLTIGCVMVTLWICQWRRRLVTLNIVLERYIQDIERILHPGSTQIGKSRQTIGQIRRIYHDRRTNWEQLRQIALLVAAAKTIAKQRR
jgi:hypothetical protein